MPAPQNASKRGPVAWALAEAALRNLRWGDADINLPSNAQALGVGNSGFATGCDASQLLTDVVVSGVARKPCYWFCFRPVSAGAAQGGSTVGEWDRLHLAQLGLGEVGPAVQGVHRVRRSHQHDLSSLVVPAVSEQTLISGSKNPCYCNAIVMQLRHCQP